MMSTTTSSTPVKSGIPDGEYRLVGWDLDTTGRRLIDEICQIAAYTPKETFSQYVMPYKNLNMNSRKRHMIRTATVGFCRMLKDLKTGKVIKSKSEISALIDFVNWLEQIRDQEPACTGIILLCHETYELAPLILIEALRRYNLLEKFSDLVKGFANCYAFVKEKCEHSMQSFSLKVLSKILLDLENVTTFSAADRSRLAYQLVHHLCQGLNENTGAGDATVKSKIIVEALSQFTSTIGDEEKAIEGFKMVIQRQNSLKPVFGPLLKINVTERKRATSLRRLLAEASFDYDLLKELWDDGSKGKDSLTNVIEDKLSKASDVQRQDLVNILVNHFDPSKPIPLSEDSLTNKKLNGKKATQNDMSSSPATTPTSASSPSKTNGSVSPLDNSPSHTNVTNNKLKTATATAK